MRKTFRAKLMAILGTATFAFVMLIFVGAKLEERADDELSRIARTYIPLLELGPRLSARFDELVRGMRDAVAAQDREALMATRALRDACLNELSRAVTVVPRSEVAALRLAIEEYYATALDVSRRMLNEETGEQLLEALDDMQGKQRVASALLSKVTAFDQTELTEAFATATSAQHTARYVRLIVSVISLTLVLLMCLWLSRSVLRALSEIGRGFARFGRGEFDAPIRVPSNDEFGTLAEQANEMARSLKSFNEQRDKAEWLTAGLSGLAHEVRGDLEPEAVAEHAVRYLARYLGAPAGALYFRDADGTLSLLGEYATWRSARTPLSGPVAMGEGLLGQGAREAELTIITDLPDDYFRLRSALGEGKPRAIVLLPLSRLGQVAGVLELAVTKPWTDTDTQLLLSVRESLAIAIEVARARTALRALLAETQAQATELERQRGSLTLSNAELTEVKRTLEQKAQELSAVSAFKSQFLANMSHELRTPLNSVLVLSSLLAEHEAGMLTPEQTEYCRTIHGAAQNLLALINQVLDLAKVESGKQELSISKVRPDELADYARRLFEPLARDKQLAFTVSVDAAGLPETIETDRRKIEQILNNLIGNAIKFTRAGAISLRVGAQVAHLPPTRASLIGRPVVALVVEDTGVGIPRAHQERIFAPFEQLEASPDRRYGGSGLGLSIARELTTLLGGELLLESVEGKGSTFVCYLPPRIGTEQVAMPRRDEIAAPRVPERPPSAKSPPTVPLSKARAPGLKILLIEDEAELAALLRTRLTEDGHQAELAGSAAAALTWLSRATFDCLVLDLGLPDVDGLELFETLQEQHRSLPPVFVHTGRTLGDVQRAWLEASAELVVLKQGLAIDGLLDEIRLFSSRLAAGVPRRAGRAQVVSGARRSLAGAKLLIVDDDMRTVYELSALLRRQGLDVLVADSGTAASEMLALHPDVELVLLDASTPLLSDLAWLRALRAAAGAVSLPVIALIAKEQPDARAACLAAGATDTLQKPCDAELLIAMLCAHLTGGSCAVEVPSARAG